MQHYYLINGKVMKGGEMHDGQDYMQTRRISFDELEDYFDNESYDFDKKRWLSSLQPCEIDESELDKIDLCLSENNTIYIDDNNPIDITDIVEEKDGKICFKQPIEPKYIKCGDCNKFYLCTNCGEQCGSEGHFIEQPTEKQVESKCEAVEFAEWIASNATSDGHEEWRMYVNPNPGTINLFTTKQLYEIFKNR